MKRLRDHRNLLLRLAVVGCGRVVERCHLPALRGLAGIALVALADPDAARLAALAPLGSVRRYADYRAMLEDHAAEAVAVCAPPNFHAEIGLAVLEAGKHLFVEKPIALSLGDAERLVQRAAAAGVQATVGFNLRWHRLVRQARSVFAAGGLGTPATMHTTFTSRSAFPAGDSQWRRRPELGGGVLFDLGIHHFDLWRFLLRCDVEEVFAHRHSDESGVEYLAVNATMANGVLVTASFSHGISDRNELEICGTKGRLSLSCYRFDGLRVDQNAPQGALRSWAGAVIGALRNAPSAATRWRRGGDVIDSYRSQWSHFIDAVRSRAPLECTLEDGRSALRVALAAAQSASEGRAVRVEQAAAALTPIAAIPQASRAAG